MATFYICIILICRVVQAIFNKRSSNEIGGFPQLIKYTTFLYSLSAILGLILIFASGNGFRCNTAALLIALFSGISLFLSTFCSVYGMKTGSVSVNSMFATAGLLVPLLAGVLFFEQPIRPLQWFGVAVFFVSAWFLMKASKKLNGNFNLKTVFLLFGSMISNGATMLAQQLFTRYVPDGDVSVFSFISFGVIAIFTGLSAAIISRKSGNEKSGNQKLSKTLILCAVLLAIAVFIINQLATLSTALVSPVILFTLINGGYAIISTLVAAILYKEKLTARSVIGLILGIASLVVIKL